MLMQGGARGTREKRLVGFHAGGTWAEGAEAVRDQGRTGYVQKKTHERINKSKITPRG